VGARSSARRRIAQGREFMRCEGEMLRLAINNQAPQIRRQAATVGLCRWMEGGKETRHPIAVKAVSLAVHCTSGGTSLMRARLKNGRRAQPGESAHRQSAPARAAEAGAAANRRWGPRVGVLDQAFLAYSMRWCCYGTRFATDTATMCKASRVSRTFDENELLTTTTGHRGGGISQVLGPRARNHQLCGRPSITGRGLLPRPVHEGGWVAGPRSRTPILRL